MTTWYDVSIRILNDVEFMAVGASALKERLFGIAGSPFSPRLTYRYWAVFGVSLGRGAHVLNPDNHGRRWATSLLY